jgi:predicted O-linked N-acetylglucosamine transferase (SPINDLY family)
VPLDLSTLQQALQHHKRNELDLAESLYRSVLAQAPGHADALGLLGQLLLQTRRGSEGIEMLKRAVAGKPGEPAFHAALGQALAESGDLDGAILAQRRAAELAPRVAAFHYNLAVSLKSRGRIEEAMASLQSAIRLQPGMAQAHNNLGNILKALGRIDEAIMAFEAALRAAPDDPLALCNLGSAWKDAGNMEHAESNYRAAIRLRPGFAEAWNNLADVFLLTARHDEALDASRRARELAPDNPVMHSNYLGMLLFHPAIDAQSHRRELELWQEKFGRAGPFGYSHGHDRTPERRLRIGYVSPDFRDHVVGRNLLPLFRRHDREGFELFCYSGAVAPDAVSEEFRALAHHTVPTAGMNDEQLASLILRDQIDILVDLALHMAGGRLTLFARKPAPVQATFAGYPGSTGLNAIDYRITDPFLDPPHEDAGYAEKPAYISSFWCYEPIKDTPPPAPLPAAPSGVVTFGCLNNFCKINDGVLELWARVMTAVPNSRLMLLTGEGAHRARTIGFMLRRGIAPEQLLFFPKQTRPDYLALYRQMDIALDTLPYNGHTTSLDALYMGVPLVSLPGTSSLGRAGLSQLTNLGLTELIARTPDDFVRIAAGLAGDFDRLAALRAGLRGRMEKSLLMDAGRFAREIEQAYREMWRKWCASPA